MDIICKKNARIQEYHRKKHFFYAVLLRVEETCQKSLKETKRDQFVFKKETKKRPSPEKKETSYQILIQNLNIR